MHTAVCAPSATVLRFHCAMPLNNIKGISMTIKIGDSLPEGKLSEFIESATEGCALGPNTFNVADLAKGKKIALFGLPGAYTPTCSAQHVPGYVKHAADLKAKGVDEIWCISVNDAFVMGAWGRDQKATGIVRMMADGNAAFSKALGLDADFSKHGMGTRSQRYSMLVDDGVVKQLNVEAGGKFEVSNAETLLSQLG
jgi:peroxiredoxin